MHGTSTIAVCGATGLQGGAVARRLMSAGYRVRALTRRPESEASRALLALGAEPTAADLNDTASLKAALAGAQGVFSVQDFWEHGYDREVEQGANVIRAAVASGVEHLVYASVGGVDRTAGLGIRHFESKAAIEQLLRQAPLRWTIFRPVTFLENFTMDAALQRLFRQGVVAFPYPGDQPFQLLALDDEADLVCAAFRNPSAFAGMVLEIASDTRRLSDVARAIGDAAGLTVQFRETQLDAFADHVARVSAAGLTARSKIGPSLIPQLSWNRSARGGWAADLETLRALHPGLRTVEAWAAGVDWAAARTRWATGDAA